MRYSNGNSVLLLKYQKAPVWGVDDDITQILEVLYDAPTKARWGI